MTPRRGLFFPRPALHETLRIPRSALLARPVFLRGLNFRGNRPLSAQIAIPTSRFLAPSFPRLSPRGIRRDRKTRDKPITRPSRKNKPENIPRQEEGLEKKFV